MTRSLVLLRHLHLVYTLGNAVMAVKVVAKTIASCSFDVEQTTTIKKIYEYVYVRSHVPSRNFRGERKK